MSSLFALRMLLLGAELLAGSTVIVALAWLGGSQNRASARHLTWAVAFGALFALPLLAHYLPSGFVIRLPAPQTFIPTETIVAQSVVNAPAPPPAASEFSFDASTIALMLGAVWFVGMCLVALRFAAAAIGLALLKHKSRPFALSPADEPKVATPGRECELRLADRDMGPITWGVMRPVVLLPKSALSWSRERLQAVLLHELGHVRRRDSLVQALSHAACAFYWPNPLVWWAAKRLRREAEMAADDVALTAGVKPSDYAGELLSLAHEFRVSALPATAFSMAAPSALEARVESVLSPNSARSGVTRMDVLKIAGAGLLASVAIGVACPCLAQAQASATPPPVTASDLPAPAMQQTPTVSNTVSTPTTQTDTPAAPVVSRPAHEMTADNASDNDDAPPAPPAPAAPPVPAVTDAPPVPPAPPAPAAPPAPPAPADGATHVWLDGHQLWADGPNVKIDGSHTSVDGHNIWIDGHRLDDPNFQLSPAEKQRLRAEIEKARAKAHDALTMARPEIERAMREVQAHRAEIERAAADARAHRADIERAVAEIQAHSAEIANAAAAGAEAAAQADQATQDGVQRRVDVERNGNDVRVREEVLHDARPAIDAALAEYKAHRAEADAAMARIKPELDKALAKIKADMAKQHVDVRIEEHLDEALRRAELRIEADQARAHEREEHRTDDQNTVVTPDDGK